jgi:hypothetical protein
MNRKINNSSAESCLSKSQVNVLNYKSFINTTQCFVDEINDVGFHFIQGERMGSPAGGASPERVSPRLLPTAATTDELSMTKKKGSSGGRSPSPEDEEEDELEISPRACSDLMQNGSDSCWNGSAGTLHFYNDRI